ncbi:MAG: ergothioneine biosynthesis protein EgtB [Methylobacteriaceae bacterium]|nr:ergothioneine biosynthesis protein EgtB [Methylobacteriaceae bacterium]
MTIVDRKLHRSAPRAGNADDQAQRLFATRKLSLDLAAPLSPEDQVVQAMEDASPTKWHLAHVTWFFETFILQSHLPGYKIFDEKFNFCFNSYYESLGERQPRPRRGLLTRPSSAEVLAYRAHIDEALHALFARGVDPASEIARLVEVGINHEQQHQELLLTDILALFAPSPLRPAYREAAELPQGSADSWLSYIAFEGGIREAGHPGDGFHWDNEAPRHRLLIHPFNLADRLISNAEWLEFMRAGGYANAALWLADGWAVVNREGWQAPNYWEKCNGEWHQMSLRGLQPIDPAAPVCHISYYEADAYARFAGKRLPTEYEWEIAAAGLATTGNTLGSGVLTPHAAPEHSAGTCDRPRQMFGDVWEWTQSAYLPYPGYRPPVGALGEYNGKFMVSQQVLRGASCVTPDGHSRPTYRNFFYPQQRWQFMGLRLAEDA